jgi:hypothetical protein
MELRGKRKWETNLCLRWNEIFCTPRESRLRTRGPASELNAALRFRGN